MQCCLRGNIEDFLDIDTDYYVCAIRLDLQGVEKALKNNRLLFLRLKRFIDDLCTKILVLTEACDTQATFCNSHDFICDSRSLLKNCYYNFDMLNNLYTNVKARYDSLDAMSAIENALLMQNNETS